MAPSKGPSRGHRVQRAELGTVHATVRSGAPRASASQGRSRRSRLPRRTGGIRALVRGGRDGCAVRREGSGRARLADDQPCVSRRPRLRRRAAFGQLRFRLGGRRGRCRRSSCGRGRPCEVGPGGDLRLCRALRSVSEALEASEQPTRQAHDFLGGDARCGGRRWCRDAFEPYRCERGVLFEQ